MSATTWLTGVHWIIFAGLYSILLFLSPTSLNSNVLKTSVAWGPATVSSNTIFLVSGLESSPMAAIYSLDWWAETGVHIPTSFSPSSGFKLSISSRTLDGYRFYLLLLTLDLMCSPLLDLPRVAVFHPFCSFCKQMSVAVISLTDTSWSLLMTQWSLVFLWGRVRPWAGCRRFCGLVWWVLPFR